MNLLLVVLVTTLAFAQESYCTVTSPAICSETEKEALLSFKSGLADPSNRLASWVRSGNCCHWAGVVCHNLTGHVIQLHLRGNRPPWDYFYSKFDDTLFQKNLDVALAAYKRPYLGGKIDNSLLNLRHLRYLDLSNNDFGCNQIPEFFGSMRSLRHLNLSSAGFRGIIPPQLGNLSNLLYLNIGGDYICSGYIYGENLHWLSGLSMLKYLDLSGVYLGKISHWLAQMNSLSSLEELHLQGCDLTDVPELPYMNSSRLQIFDLSGNYDIRSFSFLKMFGSLISLDLRGNLIEGPIPGVLQNLTYLKDLDLSYNDLNSSLPSWMGSFGQLEKLALRGNYYLQGDISNAIGNLTSLKYLDLSTTSLEVQFERPMRTLYNLEWVDLSSLSLEQELTHLLTSFLECSFNKLQHLSLQRNELSGPIPEFIGSLTSLNLLDLSYNQLNGSIPEAIGSLTSLNHLDLSENQLDGMIPTRVGQLIQLEDLYLDDNLLGGTMSELSFSNLTRLQVLSATHNQITIQVGPHWIPQFQLKKLRLSSCPLGKFPEWLRSQYRLSHLELDSAGIKDRVPTWFWDQSSQFFFVNLSSNGLYGEISSGTVSAYIIDLSYNNFQGSLPSLSNKVRFLDLSDNSFSGPISQFLCYKKDEHKRLQWMLLRNNQLRGAIPDCWKSWQSLRYVDLHNNNLTGDITDSIGLLTNLTHLQLSNNSLSGVLPQSLHNCTHLDTLDLSQNLLSGPVSRFLCNSSSEGNNVSIFLRLGNNQLSGYFPNCRYNWPRLVVLDLQGNRLMGNLPDSVGSLRQLIELNLQKNNLSGELPPSLQYCTSLMFLDIGENNFGGNLPKWIGKLFEKMRFIRFRSNNFKDNIPDEICDLQSLQILDLANNKLTGQIPRCILNFSSMVDKHRTENSPLWVLYNKLWISPDFVEYIGNESSPQVFEFLQEYAITVIEDSANLVTKGSSREYTSNLYLMVTIDLSNNNLTEQIPGEVTNLAALLSLNLSRNMLNGKIPENIGNMSSLESLDLSFNRLSGEIPQSMATMTKLSYLNLSYNNLTGRIPTSTQFSTFNKSSFLGNNLTTATLGSNNGSINGSELANGDHKGVEFDQFYLSLVLGFVVGLSIVVAPLLYSQSWRLVYFQTIDNILNRLWVLIVLPIRVRFKR